MGKVSLSIKSISKIFVVLSIIAVVFSFIIVGIVFGVRGIVEKSPLKYKEELANDAFSNTADVRIMSSNLLVHYKSWGGKPVKPRGDRYIKMIEAYKPDVIGVQEMSEEWFAVLCRHLPKNYKILQSGSTFFGILLTGMIYNSDTLELINDGSFVFEKKDNKRLRRVVYAKFRHRETGKVFVVSNTHFSLLFSGKEEQYKKVMGSQLSEMLKFANEVSKDCPVVLVGDFNTRDDKYVTDKRKDDYPKIYNGLSQNLSVAKDTAKHKLTGNMCEYNHPLYDHIFYLGDVEVDTFCVLSYDYLQQLSDHYPIFADIKL